MNIDAALIEALLAQCGTKTYPKGTWITSEGQVQRELLLVEEGVQMSFFNNDGKIHTLAFTYPPSLSGIPDSFLSQQPSRYNLQALTDSRFLTLSYDALNALFDKYPPIERLFRKITEAILAGFIHRYIELHALPMEARFRAFAQRSAHLFQLVPHKYIANYLRIDPTNFSKLYNSIKIG